MCAGIFLALNWFFYMISLPEFFLGDMGSDAENYLIISKNFTSFWDAITNMNYERGGGNAIFLFLNRKIVTIFGGGYGEWRELVKYSSFMLHISSCTFLFYAIKSIYKKIHPVALFLILSNPSLLGMIPTAMSDVLATSLFSITCALILLMNKEDKSAYRHLKPFIVGLLLGYLAITRLVNYLPVAAVIGVLGIQMIFAILRNSDAKKQVVIQFLLICIGCGLIIAPRILRCSIEHRTLCVLPFDITEKRTNRGISNGIIKGPRPARLRYLSPLDNGEIGEYLSLFVIPDAFYKTHFNCGIDHEMNGVAGTVAGCYLSNLPYLPQHFLKKSITLFDEPRPNFFSAVLTTEPIIMYKRLYGIMTYIGYVILVMTFLYWLYYKKFQATGFLPLTYIITLSGAYILMFNACSRYGYPLLPLSTIGFVLYFQIIPKFKKLIIPSMGVILIFGFLYMQQISMWDAKDRTMYPCAPEKLKTARVYLDLLDVSNCIQYLDLLSIPSGNRVKKIPDKEKSMIKRYSP